MSRKAIIWIALILIIMTTTGIITAFLLDQESIEKDHTVGFVKADYDIYFMKDGVRYEANEVVIPNTTVIKAGVYHINVVDSNAISFIENLRIDFKVTSNIDTWVRIRIIETLIFKSENQLGLITESSITTEPTQYFIAANWYDNQADDGYFYYMEPIKRLDENNANVLPFIPSYFEGVFYNARPLGYEIQLAIVVDSVQLHEGPIHNWFYDTPPWGGTWT